MKNIKTIFCSILLLITITMCVAQNGTYYYYEYDDNAEGDKSRIGATNDEIKEWTVEVLYWNCLLNSNPISIPINILTAYLPSTLTSNDYQGAIDAVIDDWNSIFLDDENDCKLFDQNANGVKVPVFFTDNENYFANFDDPEYIAGVTVMGINADNDSYEVSGTGIYFNDIIEFDYLFTWSWSSTPQPEGLDWAGIDIQTVALHEFGHLGGLAHCESEVEYESIVMYDTSRTSQTNPSSKRNLTSYDSKAIRILYGKIVVSPVIDEYNQIIGIKRRGCYEENN
ncbi:MAG: matrixin family metalloprotease [Fidelibacterota bacterium]